MTADPATDWARLDAVYERAAEEDPGSVQVFHSWGVGASEFADFSSEPGLRATIMARAQWALQTALTLAPDDGDCLYTFGLFLYQRRDSRVDEALGWFERAVASLAQADPAAPHLSMAQLHRAHCLHDQGDWPRAIAAYEAVDREAQARHWPAWRHRRLTAQLALCHLHAGHRDQALAGFEVVLRHCEQSESDFDEDDGFDLLLEAARGSLRSELGARAEACRQRLGL